MSNGNRETMVITGGAGAIGSATVRLYAEKGNRVVIADINGEAGRGLADELGADVSFVPIDIMDYASIAACARTVGDAGGTVTHLVSLAGGAYPEEALGKSILDISPQCISDTIDWNLKSHLYILREFLPLIKKDGGANRTVTVVGSISALFSFGQPAYSSAKAGMLGLVRSVANELGASGIRINAVLPGTVPTGASLPFLSHFYEQLGRATSLGRVSSPEDIAGTIYAVTRYMTSVTGQHIVADAGQTVCYPFRNSDDS